MDYKEKQKAAKKKLNKQSINSGSSIRTKTHYTTASYKSKIK